MKRCRDCVCHTDLTEKSEIPEAQFQQPKPGRQMRERTRPPRAGHLPSGNRDNIQ